MEESTTYFGTFFLFCCNLKIKNILLYTTYHHIDILRLSCLWVFHSLVTIFTKKSGTLSSKIGEEKILSKSVSCYFQTNIKN